MRCTHFEQLTSAYLDEALGADEALAYQSHLAICPLCRTHLEETRQISQLFKELRTPEVPRELHSYVMTSIERRVRGDISLRQRANEWLLRLNPKPLSYATGFALSVLMFAFTLSGFKPIPVGAESRAGLDVTYLTEPATSIKSDLAEYNRYNNLPAGDPTDTEGYELPYLNDPSAAISFSHIAYQKPGIEGMAALVQVGQDGRGKLESVIDEPNDPALVEQLWWMLGKQTFQPATVEGQPVATRIVMFVEKMDVDGASR